MEREAIAKTLRGIVAEVAELDADKVGLDANFIKDLELDSMLLLEIAAKVEKTYKITIAEADLKELTTINQAVALATRYLKNS